MRKMSALLTVVALVGAACGDSAGDTTTTEVRPTTAAVITTEPTPTTTQPTADPVATVEALFHAWN
ncbi:MAG: hypothetical protein ACE5MI_14130, partial [Acidimicrobiia bacterium]